MSAFQQLTRSEKILGAAGVVLLIGIFAFPWYHVGVPGYTINGQAYGGGSYDGNALQGPGSFFSVVALIVLIALLAAFVVRRFTTVQLPELPISWSAAELYAAIAVLALLVIKILFHVGNFGWGFYLNMAAAIVLVYGAVAVSRGRRRSGLRSVAHTARSSSGVQPHRLRQAAGPLRGPAQAT